MENQTVRLRVRRFSPQEGSYWAQYDIPYEHSMSVLTALRKVYEEIDPTLTIRQSQCLRGNCTVCDVKLNGRVKKACSVPAEPGMEYTIEPRSEKNIIRDLVCSRD